MFVSPSTVFLIILAVEYDDGGESPRNFPVSLMVLWSIRHQYPSDCHVIIPRGADFEMVFYSLVRKGLIQNFLMNWMLLA